MKTLVIHSDDPTTDFLAPIYSDIKDCTVVRYCIGRVQFKALAQSHDRIIFLGHGTERGLMGPGGFMMDSRYVWLLRDKPCVYIWCNADVFVRKYKLEGFYTGMIISEWLEASLEGVNCVYNEIEESNLLFTKAIKAGIEQPDMLSIVKAVYGGHEGLNRVIDYNYENLYETESK